MRKIMTGWLAALLITAPLAAQDAPTDYLYLHDGSRIAGRLLDWHNAQLRFDSPSVGELTINADDVAGVTTAEPMHVELESGERAIGRFVYDEDAGIQRVVDSAFGDVDLALQRVAGAWPENTPAPEQRRIEQQQQELQQARAEHEQQVLSIREQHQQEVDQLAEAQPALSSQWSARLEIGLDGATGNTERVGFNGRARARRETDYDRLTFHIGGQYARQSGEETANQVFGGAGLEVDLSDRLFTFLTAELERDDFEELQLRSTVTGGLGYFIFQEDDHELKVRAGAGFQHATFRDATESDIVAELGLDYMVEIQPWLTFTHSTTAYPTISDPLSDYRLVSETAGELPLGDAEQWSLRIGMRNKYNAMPRPGVRRLDTSYFLNLVYDWN